MVKELALEGLGPPVPYQLRHSGASSDRSSGLRSLDEIRKRGRWRSIASVDRYEKGGRVAEQLNRLAPGTQQYLKQCLEGLPDFLQGVRAPPHLEA